MGNHGNQWNFYGRKWSKSMKNDKLGGLSAGFVPTQQHTTTYGDNFAHKFPMFSQNKSFHDHLFAISAPKGSLKPKLCYSYFEAFGGVL